MRITKLTARIVPLRWCFLEIETDEGLTAWGEPVVGGRAQAVAACVEPSKHRNPIWRHRDGAFAAW